MEKIQRSFNLVSIKKRLITLYLLNFSDGVFTKALINTGSFFEVNPLLRATMDLRIFYLIKFLLPILLLTIIYKRMAENSIKRPKLAEALIFVAVSLYAVINLVHVFNFAYYFIFPTYRS